MEIFADADTVAIPNVPIFKVGTFKGKEFTKDDLEEIVENFETLRSEIKPMLKLGHSNALGINSGMPAMGWIESLSLQDNTLFADFRKVPEKVATMIETERFKRISSEFIRHYESSDGREFNRVLKGVALLGADIPAVRTMEDVNELMEEELDDGDEVFTMEVKPDEDEPNEDPDEDLDKDETHDEDLDEDTTEEGGTNVEPDEIIEAINDLEDDQRETVFEQFTESDSVKIVDAEEFDNVISQNKELRSTVRSLQEETFQDKVNQIIDDAKDEGILLEKQEDIVRSFVSNLDRESFDSRDEMLNEIEEFVFSFKPQVNEEMYTQDGQAPEAGSSVGDDEAAEEVEAIMEA